MLPYFAFSFYQCQVTPTIGIKSLIEANDNFQIKAASYIIYEINY